VLLAVLVAVARAVTPDGIAALDAEAGGLERRAATPALLGGLRVLEDDLVVRRHAIPSIR
jgi:uncharacterized protein YprB with RNaseH-like and TPR domain